MDASTHIALGWAGAILGSVLGIAGGLIGTYYSITNTKTLAERRFMVRCAVGAWIFVVAFLAGFLLLPVPPPYKQLFLIPYFLALMVAIPWINAVQARLRCEGVQAITPTEKAK